MREESVSLYFAIPVVPSLWRHPTYASSLRRTRNELFPSSLFVAANSYGRTRYSSAPFWSKCVCESVGRDGRLLETPIRKGSVLSFASERHDEYASHPGRYPADLPPVCKWFSLLRILIHRRSSREARICAHLRLDRRSGYGRGWGYCVSLPSAGLGENTRDLGLRV